MAQIHKTTTRRIRADECLELPLDIPGWTLEHMVPRSPEAAAWLAGNGHLFHRQELEAWEAWAAAGENEPLAAAARSAMLALTLHNPAPRPGLAACTPRL